jgi:hypothetical protein
MTEAEWIDKFVMTMGRLCEQVKPGYFTPEQIADLAREAYPEYGTLDPEQFAKDEFDEWPPFED